MLLLNLGALNPFTFNFDFWVAIPWHRYIYNIIYYILPYYYIFNGIFYNAIYCVMVQEKEKEIILYWKS